jgi:hypothetical protein
MNPEFEIYKQYRIAYLNKVYITAVNQLYAAFSRNFRSINSSWNRNKQMLLKNLINQFNQSVTTLRNTLVLEITKVRSLTLSSTAATLLPVSRKKALLIGVNYTGTPYELTGCIDDTTRMRQLLTDSGVTNFQVLTDTSAITPTKANILKEFTTLIASAVAGDLLIFYFSGHGSFTFDYTGDEADANDEMIISSDLQGVLDDDLKRVLSTHMKEGVTVFGLFDSCHSGTMFDLKYNYLDSNNYDKYSENEKVSECSGNVLMISGCMDSQTSAEAVIAGGGNKVQGAVSWAFTQALKQKPGLSWRELLKTMRELLKANAFTQIPQMSTDSFYDIDTKVFL